MTELSDQRIPRPPSNLPRALTGLIGRRRELLDVATALRSHRLVTMTGPGGVGKSRLALAVTTNRAPRYLDGSWLVDLSNANDAAAIVSSIASALGVPESAPLSPQRGLHLWLSHREALLWLDNCEHVRQALADLLEGLLPACPRLQILCTSRQPLGLTGERIIGVPPFELPSPELDVAPLASCEAVLLFRERAREALSHAPLTDSDLRLVADICRSLDGLPLAIELAAARTRTLPLHDLAERLGTHMNVLDIGQRTGRARAQGLRSAIEVSHQLLTPEEQRIFRRLGVFAGGWTLSAAERVCAGDDINAPAVLEPLTSLVDKSMVVLDSWRGQPRYRLLETMRAFALEKLASANEDSATRARHQAWCWSLLSSVQEAVYRPGEPDALRGLDSEADNIRAALHRCRREDGSAARALEQVLALWRWWDTRGMVTEGAELLEHLLGQNDPSSAPGPHAMGAAFAAFFAASTGDFAKALGYVAVSERTSAISDQRDAWFYSVWARVLLATVSGDLDAAEAGCRLGLVRNQDHPTKWGDAPWNFFLGEVARQRGDRVQAQGFLDASYRETKAMGNLRDLGYVAFSLGQAAFEDGDYARAYELIRETLSIRYSLGDLRSYPSSLSGLAWVAAAMHQPERAALLLGAVEQLGTRYGLMVMPHHLGAHEHAVAATRAALGDESFTALADTGRLADLDDLVAYALGTEATAPPLAGQGPPGVAVTQRELEIAQAIAGGLTNREIASQLGVHLKTIESHITHLLRKLGMRRRAQIAVWARERHD